MIRVIAVLAALGVVACGGGSTPGDVCEPGVQLACRCAGGSLGVAVCSAGGDHFGACDCRGNPAGGGVSSSSAGGVCTSDLSNIGTADFHISVDFSTTQDQGQIAVTNQRSVCGADVMFWDFRLVNGGVQMETDDGTGDYGASADGAFADGAMHRLVVERVAGNMTVEVDGSMVAGGPSPTAFGALPALAIGSDVCSGSDGTQPFSGTLGTVCLRSP